MYLYALSFQLTTKQHKIQQMANNFFPFAVAVVVVVFFGHFNYMYGNETRFTKIHMHKSVCIHMCYRL